VRRVPVEDEADDFVADYEGAGLEVFRDYDMCVIECSIRLAGVMYATLLITQINVGAGVRSGTSI
jgi:hypothetical protein